MVNESSRLIQTMSLGRCHHPSRQKQLICQCQSIIQHHLPKSSPLHCRVREQSFHHCIRQNHVSALTITITVPRKTLSSTEGLTLTETSRLIHRSGFIPRQLPIHLLRDLPISILQPIHNRHFQCLLHDSGRPIGKDEPEAHADDAVGLRVDDLGQDFGGVLCQCFLPAGDFRGSMLGRVVASGEPIDFGVERGD